MNIKTRNQFSQIPGLWTSSMLPIQSWRLWNWHEPENKRRTAILPHCSHFYLPRSHNFQRVFKCQVAAAEQMGFVGRRWWRGKRRSSGGQSSAARWRPGSGGRRRWWGRLGKRRWEDVVTRPGQRRGGGGGEGGARAVGGVGVRTKWEPFFRAYVSSNINDGRPILTNTLMGLRSFMNFWTLIVNILFNSSLLSICILKTTP